MNNRPANLTYRNYAGYGVAKKTHKKSKRKSALKPVVTALFLILIILAVPVYVYIRTNPKTTNSLGGEPRTTPIASTVKQKVQTTAVQTQDNGCVGNTNGSVIIASISKRHLWVCNNTAVLYQTAVITGDMNVVADVTPVGTYKIYAKETNVHLIGSDSRGSWNDFVYYWMPFLDNQYGVFGLHDATWRTAADFGTISPYSNNASHGCIELPLAASSWIYNWSSIGTTVTIES